MAKKILFLTLETFSAAGGIQKMGRIMAHALYLLGIKNSWDISLYASNDNPADLKPEYIPSNQYRAFSRNKITYTIAVLKSGFTADLVILSHVNLSLIACLIKLLNPGCEIWLVAHGIEVWRPLRLWKRWIWKIAGTVICVSRFTREEIIKRHGTDPNKCVVLNNALDPFLKLPDNFSKPAYLQERYHLKPSGKVIFTLTRIANTEKFKGYEQVIKALNIIKQRLLDVTYLLAGPCDDLERARVEQLISDHGLTESVILTGFLAEEELSDHFLLADLFVMPSKKEGFGIVFIEAMAFGLPVICGNADGSVDAVRNPAMGTAINPDDQKELERVILQKLRSTVTINERIAIQQDCLSCFNEQSYMNTIEKMILYEATL